MAGPCGSGWSLVTADRGLRPEDNRGAIYWRSGYAVPGGLVARWHRSLRTGAYDRAFRCPTCDLPENQADHFGCVAGVGGSGGRSERDHSFLPRIPHERCGRPTPHWLSAWLIVVTSPLHSLTPSEGV